MDLDRVLAAFHPAIADVQLGHRGLEVRALALVAQPRTTVEHVPGALDAHFHVDDFSGHELELTNRLAELFALLRITDTRLQQPLHRSDRAG